MSELARQVDGKHLGIFSFYKLREVVGCLFSCFLLQKVKVKGAMDVVFFWRIIFNYLFLDPFSLAFP